MKRTKNGSPDTSNEDFASQLKSLKNIPRFFALIWQISPKLTLLNVFLRTLKAIIPVSILYVGKEMVDEVVKFNSQSNNTNDFWNAEVLIFWIWVGFALAVLLSILTRFGSLTDKLLGDWVNQETTAKLMQKASSLQLYHFEDVTFYDNLSRAQSNANRRAQLINLILAQIQDFITLFALLVALVFFNPPLVFFLIVVVVPVFMTESHFNKESYKVTRVFTSNIREMNYLRIIATSDQVAKEIKVFGLEKFIVGRYVSLARKYYKAVKEVLIKRAVLGSVFSLLSTTAYYGAYVFVLYQTFVGILTIGTMTFLAGAFKRMQTIMNSSANRFSTIADIGLYLHDYFRFMDSETSADEAKNTAAIPDFIDSAIVFENVSFKYFGSDKYAVRNLNFTLNTGESIALVGENGAGKTTIVKLLARLYTPTEGKITWAGVDIQDFDSEDYRKRIGVIFQDFVKFMFTAKENISVGNILEKDNLENIKTAARKSLADTVINKLDKKYDQMLGKRFAEGVELSGGEWQKIAIARGYMREADLVILDEPTAALDARSEHEVFLRFSELLEGKTAVLISHRFSTVRMASRILFLKSGQIAESGTHEELITRAGEYAELFELQAQGYS